MSQKFTQSQKALGDEQLSQEQKATNFDTMRHIERVRNLLTLFQFWLMQAAVHHDQSKLTSPEVEVFTEITGNLKHTVYASDEYKAVLNDPRYRPAIEHHQKNNSHHPEFHANGINDMDLVQLVEMFFDWKAASERHATGNILTSIEIQAKKWDIPPMLANILRNTALRYLHAEDNPF